mgnify:CR=1 FL=1
MVPAVGSRGDAGSGARMSGAQVPVCESVSLCWGWALARTAPSPRAACALAAGAAWSWSVALAWQEGVGGGGRGSSMAMGGGGGSSDSSPRSGSSAARAVEQRLLEACGMVPHLAARVPPHMANRGTRGRDGGEQSSGSRRGLPRREAAAVKAAGGAGGERGMQPSPHTA